MKELSHGSLLPTDSIQESFSQKAVRLVLKKATHLLPVSALVFAAACSNSGAGEKNTDQDISNSDLERAVLEEQYELPFQGTWYLTGGPHNFRLPIGAPIDGVLVSDLDFAPKPIESCQPGQEITLKDWNIVASKSGVVTIVGDEKNKKDPNHSIVQIKHADRKSTKYVHSANIEVKKGDTVRQGQVIAHPSCEVPPDGYTTGLHLDFSEIDANNNPVDIRGLIFDGWKVDASSKNYQGTLSKNGEKTRTANGGRYGENSNGIRNDLANSDPSKAVVAGPKSPIPPISATVTSKELTGPFFFSAPDAKKPNTSIPTPKPTETPKPAVENKISLSKKPEDLFRLLLTTTVAPDELPTGMTSGGISAGEIDATGKALKEIGAVTIKIEDSASTPARGIPNGGIVYAIFPDSSGAKSASEIIASHLQNGRDLRELPYPAKIYTTESFFGVVTKIVVMSVENVTVVATFTGTDSDLMQSRTILLAKAAIKHLGKVGK